MNANSKKAKNKLLILARYLYQEETDVLMNYLDIRDEINFRIPDKSFVKEYAGYTFLHFAAKKLDKHLTERLINFEANFMIQGYHDGFTPLHCSVSDKKLFTEYASWWIAKNMAEVYPLAYYLLSVQVNYGIASNPYCRNKLSHLHIACVLNNFEAVEFFLKNHASVNESMSDQSDDMPGFTPLHLAVLYGSAETVKVLLNYGADMFAKNTKGISPLQLLIERKTKLNDYMKLIIINEMSTDELSIRMKSYESITYSFLKIMVKDRSNFVDEYGLSGLHLACTLNKATSLDSLLKLNFISVDAPTKRDSPVFPSYTVLHFAAHFNTEIFTLLLRKGAKLLARNSVDKTPLDLLIENNDTEKVHTVLSQLDFFKNIFLTDRITKLLDVLHGMRALDTFEEFMKNHCDNNICVSINSPLWPGYRLLHLAVVLNQRLNKLDVIRKDISHNQNYLINEEIEQLCTDRIKVCLRSVKNRNSTDVYGSTALHLAFELSQKSTVKLLLNTDSAYGDYPDNCINFASLSHLHIACAIGDVRAVMQLTQRCNRINVETKKNFIWYADSEYTGYHYVHVHTGSTPLHFALIFRSESIVKYLLERGAIFTTEDVNGLTPLHLSMGLRNNSTAKLLLQQVQYTFNQIDCKDKSNLLHVAAYANDKATLQALLYHGAKVNSKFQSHGLPFLECFSNCTPLQVAIKMKSDSVITPLIRSGADIYAKDKDGKTLLYYLNSRSDKLLKRNPVGALISKLKQANRYIHTNDATGLTLLHFACTRCDLELVKHLLQKGADVNAKMCTFQDDLRHGGETPLHLLMKAGRRSKTNQHFGEILKLLLDNGADVTIEDAITTPLLFACCLATPGYHIKHRFTADDSFDYEDDPNYVHFYESIQDLKCFSPDRADYDDSSYDEFSIGELSFEDDEVHYTSDSSLTYTINLMLERQKNYAINPTDPATGWSHFHCACVMNNAEIVKKFLENGVDVNLMTNPFSKNHAGGCSPLHLAIMYSCSSVIRILIENGADLNAKDREGNTLLHIAAGRNFRNEEILQILLSSVSDVNAKNCIGQTSMELLLISSNLTANQLRIYLDHGCKMVFFQSSEKIIGLLGMALRNGTRFRFIIEILIESSNVNSIDCNAIQSIVAIHDGSRLRVREYLRIIERLVEAGCDLDECGERGNALSLAMQQGNYKATKALLMLGADISAVDRDILGTFLSVCNVQKQTYYDYVDFGSEISRIIITHVWKKMLVGMEMRYPDARDIFEILQQATYFRDMEAACLHELERMQDVKITNFFTVYEFLTKLYVIAEYPTLMPQRRRDFDDFFRPLKKVYELFPHLGRVLMLQYRRAHKRLGLWRSAINASYLLLPLPDLCLEIVLKNLPNEDLVSVIETTAL